MPTIIQSLGSLAEFHPDWLPRGSYGSLGFYDGYTHDYQVIYRTQPNVRTVVDFLARNIAQLGLHVYRRVSETDRVRERDHGLAKTIARPNAFTTRYRLIEALVSDLGIYFKALWLKVPNSTGGVALLRVPPHLVSVKGGLVPTEFKVNLGAKTLTLKPEQVVYFRGYNPDSTLDGLSPLETLRRILAEEAASSEYREHYWKNSARMGGFISRPKDAPEWGEVARERFRAEFEALYSGAEASGRTAILEDGMEWKPGTFNSQESQYLEGRKLTREECARAYHVPLPMVGILDHATFSNISEQHKNLYQDCLGPWLTAITEEIDLQLLPEYDDSEGIYTEFNIQAKLAGSFEDQVKALQSAVGAPYMTRAEARARMNLPDVGGDSHQLVTPLNVLVGGQASPTDSAPKSLPAPRAKADEGEIDPSLPKVRAQHEAKWTQVLSAFFGRQRAAVESKLGAKRWKATALEDVFDAERWDRELGGDLLALATATATVFGEYVAEQAEAEFDADAMAAFLAENVRIAAEEINATTAEQLTEALAADDPKTEVAALFEIASTSRTEQIATSKVTTAANFGAAEGAQQAGLDTKVWRTNSGNPRSHHAALNGQVRKLGELFSNGMKWPGDPLGGADNLANCRCTVTFNRSAR